VFDPIRAALRQLRDELIFGAACGVWLVTVLAALLLARVEWTVFALAAGGAAVIHLVPVCRVRWKRFGLLVGSLLAFLLISEAVIRVSSFGLDAIVHPGRYQPIGAMSDPAYLAPAPEPGVIFTLRPGFDAWVKGVHVSANSLGLRDREHALTPQPGTNRILTLGTSVTMGEAIAQDRTFAAVLEQLLTARGYSVEVLNFGVGAYSLGTAQALLEARGLQFHPDIVVQEMEVRTLGETDESDQALRRSLEQTRATPPRSSFFEINSFALTAIYPPVSLRKRLDDLFAPRVEAARPSDGRYVERVFEKFARLGRDHQFRGVVFVPRPIQSFNVEDLQRAPRDRIRALAEGKGLVYVDSYDRFSSADVAEDLIVYPGDLHPNARAHARHAAAVAARLEPLLGFGGAAATKH